MFSLIRNTSLRRLPKLLEARSIRFFTTNTNGQDESTTKSSNTTVDPKEVELFSTIKDWWNPNGSQRALHAYNYARVNYIKRIFDIHSDKQNKNKYALFQGLDILDVGCGPGLFCESAARLQGNVLGVDATPATVEIAQAHAKQDPSLCQNLTYRNIPAEELVHEGKQFDIVTSLEVIEHVSDKTFFVQQLEKLTKDNGFIFVSTINKTWLSYGVTIFGAEILTRIVPRGTHEWEKYISPDDLIKILNASGLRVLNVQGFKYHPLTNKMSETSDTSVNYIIACRKE